MEAAPWYQHGLKFTCTQCGGCCGGAPGNVWVSEEEIAALAARLELTDEVFRRRYLRRIGDRGWSLIDRPNYDCIFLGEEGCQVYDLRPRQCRTWPFWRSVVDGPDDWDMASENCPGMNHGQLHDAATIQATAERDGLP